MKQAGALAIAVAFAMVPALAQSAVTDRAYDLIGTWTCATAGGSSGTMTFVRQSDGSISMQNVFVSESVTGRYDETYRLISPAQYWMWTATWRGHPDFKEAATGGLWTATSWFFDGTVTQRTNLHDTDTHRIRMIYTWLDTSRFEREFEIYEGDVWKTTSSSVCRRTTNKVL